MTDDLQKYNPYHDRLGRFTSPRGAVTVVASKTGVSSDPYAENDYGVRLEHGKYYDVRVGKRQIDPRTGLAVGDVSLTAKIRGKVDFIRGERVTIRGVHALNGYGGKLKRSVFHVNKDDIMDATPISRRKAVRGEVAAVGARGAMAGALAGVAAVSPAAATHILDYAQRRYSTTEDRAAFAQMMSRHVIRNSPAGAKFSADGKYLPDSNFSTPATQFDASQVRKPAAQAAAKGGTTTQQSSNQSSTFWAQSVPRTPGGYTRPPDGVVINLDPNSVRTTRPGAGGEQAVWRQVVNKNRDDE
jgi:hypothetical protein